VDGAYLRGRARPAAPGQAAADVRQAGVVGRRHVRRAGAADRGALVGQHRGGDVGVLHREGAAETAALLRAGQLDQVQSAYRAEQSQRPVAQPQHPQPVAGRVVGDPVREDGAEVGHPEHVDQQFGEFVDPGGEVGDRRREHRVRSGQPGVRLAHHRHARPGRRHHGVVPAEGVDEATDQRHRLGPVPAVGVHLPAAGLVGRELDGVAEPFQDAYHGASGVREHQVVHAGDEEGYPHGSGPFEER